MGFHYRTTERPTPSVPQPPKSAIERRACEVFAWKNSRVSVIDPVREHGHITTIIYSRRAKPTAVTRLPSVSSNGGKWAACPTQNGIQSPIVARNEFCCIPFSTGYTGGPSVGPSGGPAVTELLNVSTTDHGHSLFGANRNHVGSNKPRCDIDFTLVSTCLAISVQLPIILPGSHKPPLS